MKARQRTIGAEVSFEGVGLQTGKKTRMLCAKAGASSGIVFARKDLPRETVFRAGKDAVTGGGLLLRRTSLLAAGSLIQTVEHFFAALWALDIDNIAVDIYGDEIPGLDGSSFPFIAALKKAGAEELDAEKKVIKIDEPLAVGSGDASIEIFPHDGFSISFFIDYDCPSIGTQKLDVDLSDRSIFEREIAPARTFCLRKEAEALLGMGFGGGATTENTLVMDDNGPIDNALRFPDEPVRHKILDLVGDLYILGVPIEARIVAKRSGHRLNAEMVKTIYRKYLAR